MIFSAKLRDPYRLRSRRVSRNLARRYVLWIITIAMICGFGLYLWRSRKSETPGNSLLPLNSEWPKKTRSEEKQTPRATRPSPAPDPGETVEWPESDPSDEFQSPYRSPSTERGEVPTRSSGIAETLSHVIDEEPLDRMRHAAIAGAISAGITLLVVLSQLAGAAISDQLPADFSSLLDVAFMIGLSYAVYRASRVAAVVLFLYFLFSRIYVWISVGSLQGLPLALVFGYFYVQGIRGTFQYHALRNPPPLPSRPFIGVFAAVSGLLVLLGFSLSMC